MNFIDKIIKNKKNKNSKNIKNSKNNIDIDKVKIVKCENIQEYIEKEQDKISYKIEEILKENLIFDSGINEKIEKAKKFSNEVAVFLCKQQKTMSEIIEFTKNVEEIQNLTKIEQKQENPKLLRMRKNLIKRKEELEKEEIELISKLENINMVLAEIKSLAQIYLKGR